MSDRFPIEGLVHRPQAFQASDSIWNIHASCVKLADRVVVVSGAAGAGKTTFCHSLVGRGAHWVADDRLIFCDAGRSLRLSAPRQLQGLVELPGEGAISVEGMVPVELSCDDLVWIELCDGLRAVELKQVSIFGRGVRCLPMPARPDSQAMKKANALLSLHSS